MHKINQGSVATRQLYISTLLTVLVGIFVIVQPHTAVQASQLPAEPESSPAPDNVAFEYFNARFISATQVRVTWGSLAETDISAYNLYRSVTLDGPQSLINPIPIPATGLGGGAVYQYDDASANTSHIYFYWLYALIAPNNTLFRLDLPPAIAATPRILLPMVFRKP